MEEPRTHNAESVADHEHVYRCQDCGEIGRGPEQLPADTVVLWATTDGECYLNCELEGAHPKCLIHYEASLQELRQSDGQDA